MNERLYKLKEEFIKTWPIEKLEQMTIEEYTNLDKTSFCYWLEHDTRDIGSIRGGSSYKFGIYRMGESSGTQPAHNRTNNGVYAWHTKYGSTQDEAYQNLNDIIVKIAALSQSNSLEELDSIDFGNGIKWKIAFLYGDYNIIDIFNHKALKSSAKHLGYEGSDQSYPALNKYILSQKGEKDYFNFAKELWAVFDSSNSIKSEFEKWLKGKNEVDSGKVSSYLKAIDILITHFKIEIYSEDDVIVLEDLYDDLKLHQRDENGKYFYAKAKSYGNGGFYSAAVKAYIDFLNDGHLKGVDNDFMKYLEQFSKEDLTIYFSFLFEVLDKFNLEGGDDRLLFSTTKNNLAFTIGQRCSWGLFKSNKEGKYYVLSKDSIRVNSEEFTGNAPYPFFTHLNDVNFSEADRNSIYRGFEQELKRTNKTSYRKHNNNDFERTVFDKSFREKYVKPLTMKKNETGLNKILFGPPGTGKTYRLKETYFPKYTSKETSITTEKHFDSVVKECSWWQVIAIALLELGTSKVSDIFTHNWVQKKASLSNSKTVRPTLWGQLQSHTIEECENVNVSNRQAPLIFNKSGDSYWEILEDQVQELVPELYDILNSVNNFNPNPDKEIKRYTFTTFHQSFSYEDFIEGIKPIMPENGEVVEDLGYKIEDGIFKSICKDAENDPNHRYAIFIDEINRGNVSAIFGELITLIESDKRQGQPNEIIVELPYSKEPFSVPSNLDIYGSMNTADRSVEALDTALRRRFSFVEMMPDYVVIEKEEVGGIKLSEVLKTINNRIELLVDRDHTIGHSYFIGVNSKQALADAFNDKIIPLLQEYFYGDYGKIGLVLGKGFIEKLDNSKKQFAVFNYDGQSDFKTPTFEIKKVDESSVINAVELLIAKKIEEVN